MSTFGATGSGGGHSVDVSEGRLFETVRRSSSARLWSSQVDFLAHVRGTSSGLNFNLVSCGAFARGLGSSTHGQSLVGIFGSDFLSAVYEISSLLGIPLLHVFSTHDQTYKYVVYMNTH